MPTTDASSPGRTPLRYTHGDVINDRYRVLEELGHGANGAVYRVEDSFLGEEIALKVLGPAVEIKDARRELKAARSVSHRNVVQVIDIGRTTTEPSCWLIAQELVDGCSLDSFGPHGSDRLSLADAIDVVDQVLAALEAIHPDVERIAQLEERERDAGGLDTDDFRELQDLKSSGLVHRDVKPQNICRRPDGVVKLIDFGIASRANSTVHTTSATPEYAPPDADLFSWRPSYDMFAVGVIAFELVTGTSPFVDGLPARGRATSRYDPVAAPFLRLIERAISTDPSQRFEDASTMRRAFAATAIDIAIEADEPPQTTSLVAEAAAAAGMADLYERAVEVARRRQLGVREYKRSLMITPGNNRSRYLVNLEFHPDHCGVCVSPSNWTTFRSIEEGSVLEELESDLSSRMDGVELARFLDRLDAVLASTCHLEAERLPSPAQRIVEFLEQHQGVHDVARIADGTGLGRGTVRRRVNTLTTAGCSATLRGRVTRVGRNAYAASTVDSAGS